jgi:hypothetical protein
MSEIDETKAILKEAHRRNNLVIFAGTGCTAVTVGDLKTYPAATWDGLIKAGIAFCRVMRLINRQQISLVERQLKAGELVGAATFLVEKMGGQASDHFANLLGDSVGRLPVISPKLVQTLAQLRIPILTTNYDDLIEQIVAYPAYHQESKPVDLQRLVQGYQSGVIHVHGIWKEPRTVVFDLRSYYDAVNNKPLQELIRGLLITKTVLFIGYGKGLDDPNLGPLLQAYRTGFGQPHYQLVRTKDVPAYREMSGVKRVSYGDEYDDLEPFLRSLLTPSAEERKRDFLETGLPAWKKGLDKWFLQRKWPKQPADVDQYHNLYTDLHELLELIEVSDTTSPAQKVQAQQCVVQMERIVTDVLIEARNQAIATDNELNRWLTMKDIINKNIMQRLDDLP